MVTKLGLNRKNPQKPEIMQLSFQDRY